MAQSDPLEASPNLSCKNRAIDRDETAKSLMVAARLAVRIADIHTSLGHSFSRAENSWKARRKKAAYVVYAGATSRSFGVNLPAGFCNECAEIGTILVIVPYN